MRGTIRNFAALGVLAALASASNAAITFTGFSGANVTSGVTFGTTGHTYAVTPFAFAYSSQPSAQNTRTGSFTVTVTADPGQRLTSISLLPQGTIKNASYSVTSGPGTITQTAGATNSTLQTRTIALVPVYSGTYTFTFTATAFAAGGGLPTGVVNAKNFNLEFTEQPVPEPASMAALAIGGFGLIARRKRNR